MKIRIRSEWGFILLAVWLIISGLTAFGLGFPGLPLLMGLLALIAGVLILIGR
jgi:hypothetical protein